MSASALDDARPRSPALRWWARQSLGRRLAAWYAATVLATLAVLGPVVYVLIEHRLHAVFDRQLRVDLDLVEATLEIDEDGTLRWRGEGDDPEDYTGSRFAWFEAWSSGGELLFRGHPGNRDALDAGLGPPMPGVVRSLSTELGDGLEVRVLEHPGRGPRSGMMLRAYRDEGGLHRTLRQILIAFLLGAPLAGLLAALGGYLMAKRALAPIAAMAAQAARIRTESLDTRFENPRPHDELGRLTSAFNETLERLERAFTGLQRFTGDASHELRTPLTALRAAGEVGLRAADDADSLRQVVAEMLEESARLEDLLDSLLLLARGDAGRSGVSLADVDATSLLDEAEERLGVLAADKGQSLGKHAEPGLAVRADHGLLLLAFGNLLHNAIRHSPPGTRIDLAARRQGGLACLEVRDQGPGIDPSLHDRVFERFFRADPSRTHGEGGGSGLGLAIVRSLVEQQGGTVEFESAPGLGSSFRILLPAAGAS